MACTCRKGESRMVMTIRRVEIMKNKNKDCMYSVYSSSTSFPSLLPFLTPFD